MKSKIEFIHAAFSLGNEIGKTKTKVKQYYPIESRNDFTMKKIADIVEIYLFNFLAIAIGAVSDDPNKKIVEHELKIDDDNSKARGHDYNKFSNDNGDEEDFFSDSFNFSDDDEDGDEDGAEKEEEMENNDDDDVDSDDEYDTSSDDDLEDN